MFLGPVWRYYTELSGASLIEMGGGAGPKRSASTHSCTCDLTFGMAVIVGSSIVVEMPIAEASDGYIEVEVERSVVAGQVELVADEGRRVRLLPSLTSSIDRVLPALSAIVARLNAGEVSPDEIRVELGLKVGGETGLIVAKGQAEASFVVTMTWRRVRDNESSGQRSDDL